MITIVDAPRGPNSLLGRLRDANIDPMNYISFYGLRTHSELKGQLVGLFLLWLGIFISKLTCGLR